MQGKREVDGGWPHEKTDLLRSMSVNQVKAKLLQFFLIHSFEYLKVNNTNLSVENNQLLNGNEIIESAIKERAHNVHHRKTHYPSVNQFAIGNGTEVAIFVFCYLSSYVLRSSTITIRIISLQLSLFWIVLGMNCLQLPCINNANTHGPHEVSTIE